MSKAVKDIELAHKIVTQIGTALSELYNERAIESPEDEPGVKTSAVLQNHGSLNTTLVAYTTKKSNDEHKTDIVISLGNRLAHYFTVSTHNKKIPGLSGPSITDPTTLREHLISEFAKAHNEAIDHAVGVFEEVKEPDAELLEDLRNQKIDGNDILQKVEELFPEPLA